MVAADDGILQSPSHMEIAMTSTAHFAHEIRRLADDEIAAASGGCRPIVTVDKHGNITITSPTTDHGKGKTIAAD